MRNSDRLIKNEVFTEKADVKILICYVLCRLYSPISDELLCRALSAAGSVNYFDAANALVELLRDGFLTQDENGLAVTQKGMQIASTFRTKLPASARDYAALCCLRIAAAQRSAIENPCEIRENPGGGYTVIMSVRDGSDTLMKVELYAGDGEQADILKKRFESDPLLAYTGVVALLSGDIDSVGGNLLSHKIE